MSIPLGLLMKEHFQFPCFGWTLKVCIVFIVLTAMTSLACFGGGGGGGGGAAKPDEGDKILNYTGEMSVFGLDEQIVVNLTGIKDPVERNAKTAWGGWELSEETKKEWHKFYKNWQAENERNGEGPWNRKKKKKGKGGSGGPGGDGSGGPGGDGSGGPGGDGSGGPGWQDFSDERGPGSGWPDAPGWADLGVGNGGSPIPPWAYGPKNIGKPAICYLAPIKGTCKYEKARNPGQRWGYNPYMDECQQYAWSGCGGTRNRFVSKKKCEEHCQQPPPPSCSVDSGILDKSSKT